MRCYGYSLSLFRGRHAAFWRVLTALGAVLLLSWTVSLMGIFSYGSVCGKCGALQSASEFRIGPMRIPVIWQQTTTETLSSRGLEKMGLGCGRQHVWLFASGGGAGVKCAIGPGRHIWWVSDSQELLEFLRCCRQFQETGTAASMLAAALSPKSSWDARCLMKTFPKSGFARKEDFRSWIAEQENTLPEYKAILRPAPRDAAR